MNKIRLAAASGLVGAVTLISAGAAQAYPDPSIVITLPDSVIYGGDSLSYTVSAEVDCDWTVTYADGVASGVSATQTGSGTSFSGTYKTKTVSETFKSPIKATCAYDSEADASSAATASASATVTLLPRGTGDDDATDDSDDNGILPDTGGANLALLVAGGALVVLGGGAVYAARRRQTAH